MRGWFSRLGAFWLIVCSGLIVGCSNKVPDLQGTYTGQIVSPILSSPIIAHVPAFTISHGHYHLQFQVYQILGSASEGETFELWVNSPKPGEPIVPVRKSQMGPYGTVNIRFKPLSSQIVVLKQDGSCATGNMPDLPSENRVEACWTGRSFDVKVKGAGENLLFGIHLNKDDVLPFVQESGKDISITLDQAMGRARFDTYRTQQAAQRVFRAKENISKAWGKLLPNISLSSITSLNLVDIASGFVSFIFPANWFYLQETKLDFSAEKAAYLSLRANEMNMVENLFYTVERDQMSLAETNLELKNMGDLYQVELGRQPMSPATIDGKTIDDKNDDVADLGIYISTLTEARDLLAATLIEELAAVSHALAINPIPGIKSLLPVEMPDLSKTAPEDARLLYGAAQTQSYEVESLKYLMRAAHTGRLTTAFSILNPSDFISVDASYASVSDTNTNDEKALSNRIDEIFSQIAETMANAVSQYNLALLLDVQLEKIIANLMPRLEKVKKQNDSDGSNLKLRIKLERELSDNHIKRIGNFHLYLISKAKINRFLLRDYYSNLGTALPTKAK